MVATDPPVVGDHHLRAVLGEGPPAGAVEVTAGGEREARVGHRLGDRQRPAQRVGQPALGVDRDRAADAARTAGPQDDVEVDRRPPPGQRGAVAEHRPDLGDRAGDPPDVTKW